ncbi:MAG: outer membrane beta-barrel protein [Woeseiaceae bacterium]|nr:outer membrane beta-barrel protein [Woeseiaceae bacterium]
MLRSTLALLGLALSASASAYDFDYTYLDLGYGQIEFDDVDIDGDGFGIGGSFAISPDFHLFAGYNAADLDFDVDATTLSAGIGWHRGLSDVVDFVATLSYEYVELDASGFGSADDNGLGLGAGLRFAATEQLEINGGITYVDLSDSGDETSIGIGGLYKFTDMFALGLGGSWGDDTSSYTLTGRFYFGK